jgi:hypothetical protein
MVEKGSPGTIGPGGTSTLIGLIVISNPVIINRRQRPVRDSGATRIWGPAIPAWYDTADMASVIWIMSNEKAGLAR